MFSFVSSFFSLTLGVCFYVLGKSAASHSLEEVTSCRRCIMQSLSPRVKHSRGACVGCVYQSAVVEGWVGLSPSPPHATGMCFSCAHLYYQCLLRNSFILFKVMNTVLYLLIYLLHFQLQNKTFRKTHQIKIWSNKLS